MNHSHETSLQDIHLHNLYQSSSIFRGNHLENSTRGFLETKTETS